MERHTKTRPRIALKATDLLHATQSPPPSHCAGSGLVLDSAWTRDMIESLPAAGIDRGVCSQLRSIERRRWSCQSIDRSAAGQRAIAMATTGSSVTGTFATHWRHSPWSAHEGLTDERLRWSQPFHRQRRGVVCSQNGEAAIRGLHQQDELMTPIDTGNYAMLADEGIRRFMAESDALYPPDAVNFTMADLLTIGARSTGRRKAPNHPPAHCAPSQARRTCETRSARR